MTHTQAFKHTSSTQHTVFLSISHTPHFLTLIPSPKKHQDALHSAVVSLKLQNPGGPSNHTKPLNSAQVNEIKSYDTTRKHNLLIERWLNRSSTWWGPMQWPVQLNLGTQGIGGKWRCTIRMKWPRRREPRPPCKFGGSWRSIICRTMCTKWRWRREDG